MLSGVESAGWPSGSVLTLQRGCVIPSSGSVVMSPAAPSTSPPLTPRVGELGHTQVAMAQGEGIIDHRLLWTWAVSSVRLLGTKLL